MVRIEQYQRDILTPIFQEMVKYWRLWEGEREDHRKAHEKKWMPNIHVPRPYSGIESQVAVNHEMITGIDPPIQAQAVSSEDKSREIKMVRLLDYFQRGMGISAKLDVVLREAAVQGTAVQKSLWVNRAVPIILPPTSAEEEQFDKAIMDAISSGAPPPPSPVESPIEFHAWIEMVNTAGKFGRIPEPPVMTNRTVIQYQGPDWKNIPIFAMRFDPWIANVHDHEVIIERIVKPRAWVMAKAANGIFDPEQVQNALDYASSDEGKGRFTQWEEEIGDMMGLRTVSTEDPLYQDRCELWECWRQGHSTPYAVILNRRAVINMRPEEWPYEHQQYPYQFIRNVYRPGKLLGLTELKQNLPLYEEENTLRNLRIIGLKLALMPILTRAKEVGLPEALRELRPGVIIDLIRADAIGSINDKVKIPSEIWRELPELRQDADETMATNDAIRGAAAPFSRTTAEEIRSRLQRTLARQKMKAFRLMEDMNPAIPQWLMLAYQFMPDSTWRVRVGGHDPSVDVFQDYAKHEFLEAVAMDFRWVGASQIEDKNLRAQQLSDLLARSFPQLLLPNEARMLLREIYKLIAGKGGGPYEIVTQEGDSQLEAMMQAQQQAAQAQAQGQPAQGGQPA